MENKLKSINNQILLNDSDSKEILDNSNSFLKGGAMTVLLNDVVSHMKLVECAEDKHGWWSIVMLERNSKILSTTTVHRIFDASTRS